MKKIKYILLLAFLLLALAALTGCCHHVPGEPATCEYPQVCTKCGKVLHEKLSHTPGDPATCEHPQVCTVCGATLQAALPHVPGDEATCTSDQVCRVCGKVLRERLWHDYSGPAATCTEPQICARCGEVVVPASHTPSEDVSCEVPVVCTECGEVLRPAKPHTPAKDVTCTEGTVCSECGAAIPARDHRYPDDPEDPDVWTVDIEPTETTPGQKSIHCLDCGAPMESSIRTISPLKSVGLSYEVNPDGVSCTVTGPGTWNNTFLDIPTRIDGLTVTAIGDGAFSNISRFRSVTMPDTVTSIGKEAFLNCIGVSKWKLSARLTFIGESVFSGCSEMVALTLPDGITDIPTNAFCNCVSLKEIGLPAGLISIDNGAFSGCTSLTSVVLPDSVTELGEMSFMVCVSMTEITLPSSLTALPFRVFFASPLTRITFGGSAAQWEALLAKSVFTPESGLTVVCTDKTLQY